MIFNCCWTKVIRRISLKKWYEKIHNWSFYLNRNLRNINKLSKNTLSVFWGYSMGFFLCFFFYSKLHFSEIFDVNETEFSLRLIEGGSFYVFRSKIYCSSPNPLSTKWKMLSSKGVEFLWVDNELPKRVLNHTILVLVLLHVSLRNWISGDRRSGP